MVSFLLRNGESQRHLSRRFRKKVARSGIKGEVRKRRGMFLRISNAEWTRRKQSGDTSSVRKNIFLATMEEGEDEIYEC